MSNTEAQEPSPESDEERRERLAAVLGELSVREVLGR